MVRVAVFSLVVLVAGVGTAASQGNSSSVEGQTSNDVAARFGPPIEPAAVGTLRYATAVGELVLYEDSGRVSYFRPVRQLPLPKQPAKNAGDLARDVRKAFGSGDRWSAAALAAECLRIAPGARDCLSAIASISTPFWSQESARIAAASEHELQEVREYVVALLQLNPSSPVLQAARVQVERRYADLVAPRVIAAEGMEKQRQTARLLEEAVGALNRGEYLAAMKQLESVSQEPAAQALRERIQASAAAAATKAVADFVAQDDPMAFTETLKSMGDHVLALDGERVAPVRDALFSGLRGMLSKHIGLPVTTAFSARAVREVAGRELGVEGQAVPNFPWESVLGAAPTLRVRVDVRSDNSCGASVSNDAVVEMLQRPVPSVSLDRDEGAFTLSARVGCGIALERGESSEVTSAYRAAVQQVANPDFAQIQSQLEAAQVHLAQVRLKWALNPPANGWAGFAKGLEEGAAVSRVNSLLEQLQATAPFLERPVEAPYTFRRTAVTKRSAVVIDLEVIAPVSKRLFVGTVELFAEALGEDVSGVMATDVRGNRNRAESLPPDGDMYGRAMAGANDAQVDVIRTVLREAIIGLTDEATPTTPAEVAGMMLFARDLSAPAESLPTHFDTTIKDLTSTGLVGLGRFRLALPPRVAAAPASPRRTPSAGTPTRADMLKSAMAAIVTIEAGDARGSGFFVNERGELVTNAHVVEGATRIRVRTASDDVYLASVVRIDSAVDVALLRVAGYAGAHLALASGDDAPVGTDVIAIGSPLGLDGTVTRGIISARRTIAGVPYVQIDAAINPGNSGGPLLGEDGNVLGVNTWKVRPERAESLAFAVSISAVRKAVGLR